VSAVLIISTHRQLPCWKNDLALASNGERVTGKNAVVCFGLGVGYEVHGDREQSLRHFREVLEHYFDYYGTHYNIARACVLTGRPNRALVHLDLALRQSPYEPRYHSLLAEVLCTSADSAIRNGNKAVEHASLACRLSGGRNALCVDTLAAAYAEAGQFPQAIATATRAMQLAAAPEVQEAIRDRIRLYSDGKPFRGILLHDALVRRR
jgi:tetratricopeptide (TPR) repeat protein